MLTDNAIRTLATKLQTTELNVRREYAQHLFLSYFYQQPLTDQIYFKGGTALRMLYGSPRFSEDLDFSSALRDVRGLEAALLETLTNIARENVAVELVESKTTTGGYLAIISIKADGSSLALQVEISLREGKKRGEAMTVVSDFVPPYTLVALAREQLVDEKLQALLHRKKARDFYDLYFLLRANLLSPRKKDLLAQAMRVLKSSSINFERELKAFLPKSHWAIIRGFPGTLKREIERFL